MDAYGHSTRYTRMFSQNDLLTWTHCTNLCFSVCVHVSSVPGLLQSFCENMCVSIYLSMFCPYNQSSQPRKIWTIHAPQLSIADLKVKYYVLLSTMFSPLYTALQMKNSRIITSTINPVNHEKYGQFMHSNYQLLTQ